MDNKNESIQSLCLPFGMLIFFVVIMIIMSIFIEIPKTDKENKKEIEQREKAFESGINTFYYIKSFSPK